MPSFRGQIPLPRRRPRAACLWQQPRWRLCPGNFVLPSDSWLRSDSWLSTSFTERLVVHALRLDSSKGRSFGSTLRHEHIVSLRHDVPKRHHGVVFVHHVVAVNRIFPDPVAEAEEELHPLIGMQLSHVLARI